MQTKRLFQVIETPSAQALRRLRGPYSQKELAAALQIHEDTVTKWEAGGPFPTPTHMRKLLIHAKDWTRRLGVNLLELLDELDGEDPRGKEN